MKSTEEQLNALHKTVMNTEEKDAMRGAVISYMQENPIHARNVEDSRLQYQTSKINHSHLFINTKKHMTAAIVAIVLLLGGGTSFAAESAVPGDVLYPIKIHVNENIQELAAVSDEAEAKVQARLAERRLEEAEKLASEGKLTAEASSDLVARFNDHSEHSKEHRAKVEEDDDVDALADISSNIEVSLGAHKKLLEDIEHARPETEDLLNEILSSVRVHLEDTASVRAKAEAKVFSGMGSDTEAAANGVMKASQNKIDEVKKFIDAKKDTLSTDVYAEVDARIKAADAAMAEGQAKIEAKAYSDAFALFKKAEREAQSAKFLAATTGRLDIVIEHHDDEDALNSDDDEMHEGMKVEGEDDSMDDHIIDAQMHGEADVSGKDEEDDEDAHATETEASGGAHIQLNL